MRTLSRVMAMALFAGACHGQEASNPEAPPDAGASASADGAGAAGDTAFVDAVAGQRACSPLPEKLLEIQRGFTAVAVDREDIFVLGAGVQRIARFGPLDSVPMGGRLGNDMVVAGNDIIWSENERLSGGGWAPVLYKTERGLGQTPQRLSDVSQAVVGKFAVRGAHIYFHTRAGLARIDKDGRGYVPNVVGGEVYSFSLDDDGQFISWSNAVGVWRQSLVEANSPSPPTATLLEAAPPLMPKLSRPILIFGNDATHVYSRIDEGDDFVVMRTPKAGGISQRFGVAGVKSDMTIALDGNHIYLADATGSVFRTPKTGGPLDRLGGVGGFDDDDFDTILAFDEQNVYFQAGPPPGADPSVQQRASDDDRIWLMRMCK